MLVWCGRDHSLVYNDAAIALIGDSHPSALGRTVPDAEDERWRTIRTALVTAVAERKPLKAAGLSLTPVFDGDELVAIIGTPMPPEPVMAAAREDDEERPRVLVVEDDSVMRQHLSRTLEHEFDVRGAEHGADALRMAVADAPDLIVTDVNMPELDGIALVRALRANPRTSQIPVILVTAQTREQARAAELAAGADDYLVKPFTQLELRERVHLQLALAKIRGEESRKANRAKDDFLGMVGHELRNPLSTLSTMLQALLMRTPTRELELMDRSVRQLSGLVEDLLESSRLSRGKIPLNPTVVELATIVDRALEHVDPVIKKARNRVLVNVPRTGLRVSADVERLSRALANVLTNAAQNTPAEREVAITAVRDGARVRLQVVDQGIGIAADRLNTVFQAFQNERREGGLGLGLAMARSIVELHHGTIVVTSGGTDLGTQCTIDLPVTEEPAHEAKPPVHAKRHRLLLVEDNDDAARALKVALEQLGYDVALAHDAPIAINLAKTFRPDVALLDLGLPVMDGWELAKRLRDASAELPIVAVTAKDQDSDKQKSSELGFAEHLVKPIDLPRLKRIVDELSASSASGS